MSDARYNTAVAEVVRNFLEEEEWNFDFDEERGIFRFGLRLKCKLSKLKYVVDVRRNEMLVYGYIPISGDPDDTETMNVLSEYITRVNYALRNGNFEMDYFNGEIRYKSFVDLADTMPGQRVIRNSIWITAMLVEKYGDGFGDIIFGNATARAACAKYDEYCSVPDAAAERLLEDIFGNGEGDEE